jgi:hypothetical protein
MTSDRGLLGGRGWLETVRWYSSVARTPEAGIPYIKYLISQQIEDEEEKEIQLTIQANCFLIS